METQSVPQVKDELGEKVQKLFQDFLEEYVYFFFVEYFMNSFKIKRRAF